MDRTRYLLLVAALITCGPSLLARAGDRPRVVLRPNVSLTETAVCLGHIADIHTEDAALRKRLATLDLVELPLSGPPTVISRSQVSFRMQLAGIDSGQVRLEGADFVHVGLAPQERLEGRIEVAARQALLEKLGGKAADFSIELGQRIVLPLFKENSAEMQLEAEAPSHPLVPGRVYVNVSLYVRSAHRMTLTVSFDVKPIASVLVALRPIAAGDALSDRNVRMERVAVDHPVKPVSVEEMIGRRARRHLAAGQAIAPEDLEAATAGSPVLIHQHDVVNLVVRSGGLQVTARGQAMEDGRAEQAIRVRNIDSNTIVTGRVVDRAVVEVDLLRAQP